MADIKQQVVFDFQSNLSQVTQEMSDLRQKMHLLKEEQERLNKDFKDGIVDVDQFTKGMMASENQMKDYQRQINTLSAKSFKDLIGAFKDGVLGAKSLGSAVKTAASLAGKSIKMLFANPLGIAITLVTTLVTAIRNVISRNDKLATSFSKLGKMATVPLRLIERAITPIANGLGFLADKVTSFIGKLSPLANNLNKITDLTENLQDAQLKYNLAAAATEVTLNNLKAIYEDSTKPLKERIEALKEAKEEQLALADLQNRLNEAEFERVRQEAINNQRWKLNQKQAFELMKYNPAKTLKENLKDFYFQLSKVEEELDDELKESLTKAYAAWITSQNAISKVNADFARKESSLINQEEAENKRKADEANKRADEVRKKAEETNKIITQEEYNLAKERLNIDKEYWKDKEGLEADIARLNIKYAEEELDRQKSISDLEVKLAETNSRELKRIYQEQIDLLRNQGVQALTIYSEETKRLIEAERENIKNINFSSLIDGDDAKEAEEFLKKREELLKKYPIKLSDEEALNNDLDALKQSYDEGLITQEEFQRMSLARQQEYEEQKQTMARQSVEAYAQYANQFLGGVADIMGSIAQAYHSKYEEIVGGKEELSKEEAKQAIEALEREKSATLAQIALQQAMSIGNTILAATTAAALAGPLAPVVLASTMASLLASVISGFVNARQTIANIDSQIAEVRSRAYATGGYIEGAGSATSDSIPARLSNGESVINARSTAMFYDLLSAINQAGGGVAFPDSQAMPIMRFANGGVANTNYDNVVKAMRSAVNDIQPVVSVKEITKVQNRIITKEII